MKIAIVGRLALASFGLVLVSCGGSSKQAAQATDKSKDWYAALVDDTTDSQMRVRMNDLANDSFAGPLAARAHSEADSRVEDPAGAALIKAVDKSDVIVVAVRKLAPDADAVVVIAGVPSGTTPGSMVDASNKPFWKKAESPVAGVDEWQLVSGDQEQQAARLAVLPGVTWVLATGAAVPRMNAAFTGGTPAAYSPASPGGGKNLMEALIVGQALEKAKSDAPDSIQPLVTPLKKVAFHFDGGDSPGMHGVFTYADEGSAGQSETAVKAMAAHAPMLRVLGDLQIAHSGSDLTVDFPISPAVRDLILAQGASDKDSDAPDSRPKEIKPGGKKKKGR